MIYIPSVQLDDMSKGVLALAIRSAKVEGKEAHDYHLVKEIISNKSVGITPIIDKITNGRSSVIAAKISSCTNGEHINTVVHRAIERNRATYGHWNAAIKPTDLLISVLTGNSCVSKILREHNVSPHEVAKHERGDARNELEFISDMTAKAAMGEYDPCIGMDDVMNRMMKTLLRKEKANPVLVGEPGVGKTSVVEKFAQAMAAGNVPTKLKDYIIYEMSIGQIVANTTQRGMLEERFNRVMSMLSTRRCIVFIDEIHTVMASYGIGPEIRDMMKPFLTGKIKVIGATTLAEYNQHIQKDAALERRFQPILVNEPSHDVACEILRGSLPLYTKVHGVTVKDEHIPMIVSLAARYNVTRRLPDSALDILDEAMAEKSLKSSAKEDAVAKIQVRAAQMVHTDKTGAARLTLLSNMLRDKVEIKNVSREEIISATSSLCEVEINSEIGNSLMHRVERFEKELDSLMIGQIEAKEAVVRRLKANLIGLRDEERPIGCFMFLGPTGVGKTWMAKALAKTVMGSEKKIHVFDMAEYSERHTLSRLIGSPPGYVGHGSGGQLTNRVMRERELVIVFDELEKASDAVIRVLLGLNENGYITDGMGRRVTFRNCIIIATGNIGTGKISELSARRLGFGTTTPQDAHESSRKQTIEEVKDRFNLEFVNRWDDIVVFKKLTRDELMDTVDVMLRHMYKGRVKATKSGREALVELAYSDPLSSPDQYGARPIRRVIETLVADEGFKFFAKNKDISLVISAKAGKPILKERK